MPGILMDSSSTAKTAHGRFAPEQWWHNRLTLVQLSGTGRPLNMAGICMGRRGT